MPVLLARQPPLLPRFGFAFAVAFKARRRRNAVKRGLILLTYPEWEFSGFPYNRRGGKRQSAKPRRYQERYPSRFPPSLVGTTPIDYVLIPRGITTPKLNGRVMVKIHHKCISGL
jgi:hypothetical protein